MKHDALKAGWLPALLGYRLRLAQQAVFRDFAARVSDLSPGRTGVLDGLEARGLVERRRGADRRTNGLWLTRAGRAQLARIRRRIELHERRVSAHLSAAERARLIELLAKLAP